MLEGAPDSARSESLDATLKEESYICVMCYTWSYMIIPHVFTFSVIFFMFERLKDDASGLGTGTEA